MIRSSTSPGLIPARSTTARTTCPPSTGASVSLNEPRKDLVSAVRAVATMTASCMLMFLLVEGVATDGVDDAAGAFAALDFHGDADHHLYRAVGQCLDLGDFTSAADARAYPDRRGKAHPVAAVVDAHLDVFHVHQLRQEVVDQRQGQVTVGDGAAERAGPGFHRVHMDPLVVTGGLGKGIDALLVDDDPLGGAQALAYGLFQGGCVGERGGHVRTPRILYVVVLVVRVLVVWVMGQVRGTYLRHAVNPRKRGRPVNHRLPGVRLHAKQCFASVGLTHRGSRLPSLATDGLR